MLALREAIKVANRSQRKRKRKSSRRRPIRDRSIPVPQSPTRSKSNRNNKREKSNRRARSKSNRILRRRQAERTCTIYRKLTFALARSSGLRRIQRVKSFTMRKLILEMEKSDRLQVVSRKTSLSRECRINSAL